MRQSAKSQPHLPNVALRAPQKRAERDSDADTEKEMFYQAKTGKMRQERFQRLHDYA